MANGHANTEQRHLVSAFRGLYRRVANRLNIDPSYVSRVARGERQSREIEAALEDEMRQTLRMLRINRNDRGHRAANHNGASRSRGRNNGSSKTGSVRTQVGNTSTK
jgi:hypothetical protein